MPRFTGAAAIPAGRAAGRPNSRRLRPTLPQGWAGGSRRAGSPYPAVPALWPQQAKDGAGQQGDSPTCGRSCSPWRLSARATWKPGPKPCPSASLPRLLRSCSTRPARCWSHTRGRSVAPRPLSAAAAPAGSPNDCSVDSGPLELHSLLERFELRRQRLSRTNSADEVADQLQTGS